MRGEAEVRLGDVARFIRGITFKPGDVVPVGTSASVACMRTRNVQAELDLTDVWGIPEAFVKRNDQYLIPGDVLVSSANSWNLVGKCCWVPQLQWRSTFGGFISVLRPDTNKVDPRYLFRWFASDRTQTIVRSFGQQTTNISNLNFDRCLKLPIPLPPLAEQRRIAKILGKADALRAKRRAALARLETLTESIFLTMFGDPVTNPKGWPDSMHLGDVADIASGITIGRNLGGRHTRPVPYLAVVNVQDRRLRLDIIKTTQATDAEIERYRLQKDDLLLTEGGDPDKLGRGSLWTADVPDCIHQNHVFRIRLQSATLTPKFLSWLVGSDRGKRYFRRSAKQTTGIASINMTQLRAFPLLCPPVELQNAFGERLSEVDRLARTLMAATDEMDALFTSIQHCAFDGGI